MARKSTIKVAPVPVAVEDHLSEDPPIAGQNFVAVSFVSPEDVIARRDAFATTLYLKSRCDGLSAMLDELAALSKPAAKLAAAFRERHQEWLSAGDEEQAFDAFMADNQESINRQYSEMHGGACCTRGIKIRGVYETLEGATARCKLLRANDPNHNVFVASVGKWCPWSPAAQSIEDVQYGESELNGLMQGYKKNAEYRAQEFAAGTQERVAAAKKEGQAGKEAAELEDAPPSPQTGLAALDTLPADIQGMFSTQEDARAGPSNATGAADAAVDAVIDAANAPTVNPAAKKPAAKKPAAKKPAAKKPAA